MQIGNRVMVRSHVESELKGKIGTIRYQSIKSTAPTTWRVQFDPKSSVLHTFMESELQLYSTMKIGDKVTVPNVAEFSDKVGTIYDAASNAPGVWRVTFGDKRIYLFYERELEPVSDSTIKVIVADGLVVNIYAPPGTECRIIDLEEEELGVQLNGMKEVY